MSNRAITETNLALVREYLAKCCTLGEYKEARYEDIYASFRKFMQQCHPEYDFSWRGRLGMYVKLAARTAAGQDTIVVQKLDRGCVFYGLQVN